MKKLMLLPLLAGVIWVCPASPAGNSTSCHLNQTSQMAFSQDLLTWIFNKAVPMFQAEYAITTSVAQLQTGYDDGTVTVQEIAGSNTCTVTLGGSTVLVDFDDYF